MAVQAARFSAPSLQLDLDHTEQVIRTISAITIDPFKNILFYVFPWIGAMSGNYIEMRGNDPAQEAMMPAAPKASILREICLLKNAAGIRGKVIPYTGLNHSFSNCGGGFSLTNPALFIPHQHLFRAGRNPFTQDNDLPLGDWNYTDDETRFLIARELGHIKYNDQLLRIAMKITLLAAIFTIYATPIGMFGGCAGLAAAVALHLISEKCFAAKMDLVAVEILSHHINDRPRAIQTALSALNKMIRQNIARRENSRICHLYISKLGNNLLDFQNPFLTSRIQRLQNLIP